MGVYSCPHCGGEIEAPEDLAGQVIACERCGGELTVPQAAPSVGVAPPPLPGPPSTRLAVASVVLGGLSFLLLGPLAAVPAIITGRMARSNALRDPRAFGGGGLALTGLILGCVNLALVALLVAVMLPALVLPGLDRARGAAYRASCANNEKQMGLTFKMFSFDSPGQVYPELSREPGRLIFANEAEGLPPVYPEYMTWGSVLVCPGDGESDVPRTSAASADVDAIIDDHSYFYLGYVITDDAQVQAFYDAYEERVATGIIDFSGDLPVPEGTGTGGSDVLFRLREGIERFVITDINNPAARAIAQSRIPVLIERRDNHTPEGGNVLFMDGHVELIPYPGKWPMTEKTMGLLESLAGKDDVQ